MNNCWIQLGSAMMLVGVSLGAFGAHALKGKLTEHYLNIYKTGVFYHLIHALAIFVVAWLSTLSSDPKIAAAGVFFILGIIIFSGSLYVLTAAGIKWLGSLTPVGGICFIIGWFLLCLAK